MTPDKWARLREGYELVRAKEPAQPCRNNARPLNESQVLVACDERNDPVKGGGNTCVDSLARGTERKGSFVARSKCEGPGRPSKARMHAGEVHGLALDRCLGGAP